MESPCFGSSWCIQPRKFAWLGSSERDDAGLLASSRSLSTAKIAHELILMELVGALGLDSTQQCSLDPYCQVEIFDCDKQAMVSIHRTDAVRNDGNPIWTAKTKSLCLLSIPLLDSENSTEAFEFVDAVQDEELIMSACNPLPDAGTRCSVVIRLFTGSLGPQGTATIPFDLVLSKAKKEERFEVQVALSEGSCILPTATLAVRFRFATSNDLNFLISLSNGHHSVRNLEKQSMRSVAMKKSVPRSIDYRALDVPVVDERRVAADINFRSVSRRSYFRSKERTDENGRVQTLVKPYPNPELPSQEWMSRDQIDSASEASSNQWVQAGSGTAGTLFLEVLKCDGLPMMDPTSSDPFVAVALEDNFLRTDVIWERTSPRWPFWCTRAFQFDIHHPSSLVFISVNDFDESPLDDHDPIGRLVLQLGSFRQGLTYTLHYPLQDDPNEKPPAIEEHSTTESGSVAPSRGTITLRLRLQWRDEAKAMKLFLLPPPRFIINVDNRKSFDTLGYTIRGAAYMERVSMSSVSILANEITSYLKVIYYSIDVWLEIFLWRGRLNMANDWSVWFPFRSVVFFCWSMALVERPDQIIPIQLLGVAWVLLSINYHASRSLNPWERVPSNLETECRMWFGRSKYVPLLESSAVAPNEGVEGAARIAKLDNMKSARMAALISELLSFASKISKVYGGEPVEMTTARTNWSFLSGQLSSVHMVLTLIVSYLRVARTFVSWKSVYTAVFTTNCIIIATLWILLPVGRIFHWCLRIAAVFVHGPWFKLVDMWYFRPWYETRDELLQRIDEGRDGEKFVMPDFDSILGNKTFQQAARVARKNTEDLTKLRDMRSLLFGGYCETIPSVDNSRFPSIPLPPSTAAKESNWRPLDSGRGYYVPGQRLYGTMIHEKHYPR